MTHVTDLVTRSAFWEHPGIMRARGALSVVILGYVCATACSTNEEAAPGPAAVVCDPNAPPAPRVIAEKRPRCTDHDERRKPLFGDLHVHTKLSFDAFVEDVRTSPADAYVFAKGGEIEIPANGKDTKSTQKVKLKRPLDFAAVTDHSEFLGEVLTCTDPKAAGYDSPTCVQFRKGGFDATTAIAIRLSMPAPTRSAEVCGDDGERCVARARDGWAEIRDAAEAAYDRTASCRFTSFVAYEWTGATGVSNLHRNVIFRDDHVPDAPVTYFDEPTADGLLSKLGCECAGKVEGCDVLSIPHNSNLSNGKMFAPSYEAPESLDEQRARAMRRARVEPLIEIFQHKGNSECFQRVGDPSPDPLCEIEQVRPANSDDCKDGVGSLGMIGQGCVSRFDFVRGVLVGGLDEEARLGTNPYRLGVIGSTDTHVGTPGATDEESFAGHLGGETTPLTRLALGPNISSAVIGNPGGLVGVWATENSRHAIFDALARREAFGTSGARIVPRVFASWGFSRDLCKAADYADTGYAEGVPMGGVLGKAPSPTAKPTFFVLAERDPDAAGQDLERVQIIKGSRTANGELKTRVYDVIVAPGPFDVDLATCASKSTGAPSLCTTWVDPDFDPAARTFYYVRVVATPSCRWSTRQCNALPEAERPPACSDPSVQKSVREMAWASPVWFSP